MEKIRKILIVDDAVDFRSLMRDILLILNKDFIIFEAPDGHEALKIVSREQPDCVLLDLQMPGMNGYEVCSKIRFEHSHSYIAVIFITGHFLSKKDRAKGYEAGGDDYLGKPFDNVELFTRLTSVFRFVDLHKELMVERDSLDIKVKKQTKKIHESQQKLQEYKNVVEGSEDLIVSINKSYEYVLANEAFLKFNGKKRNEVINNKLSNVVGEFTFNRVKNYIDQCFNDEIIEFELEREIQKTGKRYLNIIYYPLKDLKGNVREVTAVIKDNTERKLAELEVVRKSYELAERNKELRCLYNIGELVESRGASFDDIFHGVSEIIPTAFQYTEITCVRIKTNDASYETTNFKETKWKLFRDITAHKKKWGVIEVFYLEEKSDCDIGPFFKEEGQLVESVAERLGKVIEWKKAEQSLEEAYEIINTSPAVIFLWKNEKKWPVEFVSENVNNLFGYTSEEFMSGKITYADIVHKDDLKDLLGEVQQYRDEKRKRKIKHEPYRIITKSGKIKWIDGRTFFRRNKMGLTTHHQGVVLDISELRKLEEQKKNHQSQLVQADKMASLGILVSGMAHEINNPMNFIKLNVDVLSDIIEDLLPILDDVKENKNPFIIAGLPYAEIRKRIKDAPESICVGVDRINKIVSNLKGFARMDVGDSLKTIDINSVIGSSVSIIDHLIKKTTRNFKVNYAKNVPGIQGNYHKLEQVFMNLIINACQSLSDSRKGVSISTSLEKKTKNVVIKIVDKGIGMTEENMKYLLDPFYTTKRDKGGTGLGLSVTYTIIKEHGGSLEFKSKRNQGTTATVKIPISK